ncbi:ROK family transcriptional regulator [Flindersiella endophytica]
MPTNHQPVRSRLITPTRVGEVNRARVLQTLYELGPQSRAGLARVLGVPRGTIQAIVQPLLDSGLLAEQEPVASSAAGGKPARPLWFTPASPPIAAAHLLPGRVRAALVSADGRMLSETSATFRPSTRDSAAVLSLVADCLANVIEAARTRPLGVGIAVAGMVDADEGTIVEINLAPGLHGAPLGAVVSSRLDLPTYIDVHPRVQALGDLWFGLGRGRDSFVSLYTGEALGAGFVIDGRIHRGPGGLGGEVGHTTVAVSGERCRCGQVGCWETLATYRWLRAEAKLLGLPSATRMTAERLAGLAAEGSSPAAELLDRYARNLAYGIANLHQTLAPEVFLLHGDAAHTTDDFRAAIESHARDLTPMHPSGRPTIIPSDLDDATLLGAAGLVISHTLHLRV